MKLPCIVALLLALSGLSLAAEEAPTTLEPISKTAKKPRGVNTKLMSKDPKYGYTMESPILVGSKEEYGGPAAEKEYFESLLDATGKPVKFVRKASGGAGPEGKPLDIYEVTVSDGTTVTLYISMYHPKNKPEKQAAPVGFYKKRG